MNKKYSVKNKDDVVLNLNFSEDCEEKEIKSIIEALGEQIPNLNEDGLVVQFDNFKEHSYLIKPNNLVDADLLIKNIQNIARERDNALIKIEKIKCIIENVYRRSNE